MKSKLVSFLLLALAIISYSCQSSPNDANMPASIEAVEVVFHPAFVGDKIGMPIAYDLQIKNPNPFPIKIIGFTHSIKQGIPHFTYSSPNAAYLIAPDGQNLLSPYADLPSSDIRDESINIDAEGEFWLSFSVSKYAHIREPGMYTLWLELQDDLGQVHRSNEITFAVEDVEPSMPKEAINLSLQFDKEIYTVDELLNLDVDFEYTFTNQSDAPITILRQKIGLNINVVNPIYELTITDESGHILPIMASDAFGFSPVYDDSDMIVLLPGESHTRTGYLPHFPGMRRPGKYHIRLTYIVYRRDILSKETMNWGESVFVGWIESNEVTIKVEN